MQTDTWLTDTTQPGTCPLCSRPLAAGSNTCSSCGFTAHEPARGSSGPARTSSARQSNPVTPIPARASARRSQGAPGGVASRFTSTPTQSTPFSASSEQARGRRHDSANYEAVSSLSSLSLIISETPTAPPRSTGRPPRQTARLEHIDEIDTVPQRPGSREAGTQHSQVPAPAGALSLRFDDIDVPGLALVLSEAAPPINIDEIDTVPDAGQGTSRALQLVPPAKKVIPIDAASWTAGPRATDSLAARFIASRTPARRSRTRNFNPLDRVRWWLLRPGHIEFLLWLAGSILLFGITFLLLLSIVLSAMLPGAQARGNFPRSNTAGGVATPALAPGLSLSLAGSSTLGSGAELHLQGQGFRPHSQVTFWLDGRWSLLDQQGRSAIAQTDAGGHFSVTLWLGQGANWSAGRHQILAREMDNGHQAAVSITITPGSTTPEANSPGPQSTPVPPAHPTPAHPTSTPTPARPTATPGQPSPTAGITPTASPSGTKAPGTPTGSPTAANGKTVNSTSLGNDLNTNDGGTPFARLLHLNPLIWLIGICYLLSMFFMGMAGVLRRRRR